MTALGGLLFFIVAAGSDGIVARFGWAEVFRKDRAHSSRVEVSFDEYVGRKNDGTINGQWSKKPATMIRKVAIVQALCAAHRSGILKGDLNEEIGAALCQIDDVEAPMQGGTEKVQPLENQSSWHLGYYAGRTGKPLTGDFDIAAARRRKGLTQAQLAELVGVDQALVSRWESGRVNPGPESVAKLKKVLL